MKSILYLTFSILLGLYLIYISFNVITSPSVFSTEGVIWLIAIYVALGLLELLFIKRYKKYSNPEFKQRVRESKMIEQIARNEAYEKLVNEKTEKQKLVPGSDARKKLLEADLCIKIKHVTGLPLAEGSEVYIYRAKDKVIFERNQDTYELDIKKVRDILFKTDVEIQKSYVSSVGGAVGGYALFGPLGAMVGGRAKQKESKIEEKYLIFSYDKDGVTDYISFDVTSEPKASFFNNHYYELNSQERRTQSL